MRVTDGCFLLFLLAAVFLYYLTPKKQRWIILLFASAVFYLLCDAICLPVLLLSIGFSYIFARAMEQMKRTTDKAIRHKKLNSLLFFALFLTFAPLLLLKYSSLGIVFSNAVRRSTSSLLLPLGISFYSFQSASYLIDVKRGKIHAERNFARFALYISWFPQLVQGPIGRFSSLAPQLYSGNELSCDNLRHGLQRMMFGLLKKVYIADALAECVQTIWGNYASYSGPIVLLGAVLYSLQLYCDFSGGIDLLSGASTLFGVDLSENFRQPFFAASLSDFWRRWHITLGQWMRDYLYYPLCLSRPMVKLSRRIRKQGSAELASRLIPALASIPVFILVGLWHGPGWNNIVYGLWNGLWIALELLTAPWGDRLFSQRKNLRRALGIGKTFFIVSLGRIFAHSTSLTAAFSMLGHCFVRSATDISFASLGLNTGKLLSLGISILLLFIIGAAREKGQAPRLWLNRQKPIFQFIVLLSAILLLVFGLYANGSYTPIAYVYENI